MANPSFVRETTDFNVSSIAIDVGTASDANRFLTIMFSCEDGLVNISAVDVGGVAATEAGRAYNTAGADNESELWYVNATTLGTLSGSQTITATGESGSFQGWKAQLWDNCPDPTLVNVALDENTGNVTTQVMDTAIDSEAGDLVVAVMGNGNGTRTYSSSTSVLAELSTTAIDSADMMSLYGIEVDSVTARTYSVVWSGTISRGSGVVAVFRPAAAPVTALPPPSIQVYQAIARSRYW